MQPSLNMMLSSPLHWRRILSTLASSVLGVVFLSGCMTWSPTDSIGQTTTTKEQAKTKDTFAEVLRHCRLREPGRMNRKLKTSAAETHVRQCLQARGWLPDGTPIPNEADATQTDIHDDDSP